MDNHKIKVLHNVVLTVFIALVILIVPCKAMAGAYLNNAWLAGGKDADGDGYYESFYVEIDGNVSGGGSAQVYAVITDNSGNEAFGPWTITGTGTSDDVWAMMDDTRYGLVFPAVVSVTVTLHDYATGAAIGSTTFGAPIDGGADTVSPLSTNGTWNWGSLETGPHWFSFQVHPGLQYLVETGSLGPNADTVIFLFNSDGEEGPQNLIGQNDDRLGADACGYDFSGDCRASRVVWNSAETRTLYVLVDGYGYTAGTDYGVRVLASPINYVPGTAQVFYPSPVVSSQNTSLQDNFDQDSPELNAELAAVALPEIMTAGSGYHLDGAYASTRLTTNRATESSPDFLYTRSDDRFEEANAFYHIDRAQRYIQSLGFQGLWDQPIAVNAHASEEDNAGTLPGHAPQFR